MNEIYTWIRNIVIYMILNTIIMNLLGNSSYKKYVSIVSGMILILLVVAPLIKYLKIEDKLDYYLQANDFTVETSDFKNDLKLMEEEQSNAVFAEYKDKIKMQTELLLKGEGLVMNKFNVTFNRDTESTSFGEILKIDIEAGFTDSKKSPERLVEIDEIEISDISTDDSGKKNKSVKPPSPAEINIKIKLSDFYNMDPDNINITIQGG